MDQVMSDSTTGAYDIYAMTPADHIKAAERLAVKAEQDAITTEGRQHLAILSLAHATIAQAQMQGALRA